MNRQNNENADLLAVERALKLKSPKGSCFIGFDGYVDEIYRVVEKRCSGHPPGFYEKIEEFGRRIILAAGKSADIEIIRKETRFGGNAPIMADALAALSLQSVCIGQMDTDEKNSPFLQMHPYCSRISTGRASRTIALEFTDGKIMLGSLDGKKLTWGRIKEKTGFSYLKNLVEKSGLIGIVNWSGMEDICGIMSGLQTEILDLLSETERRKKYLFFDLADPSALQGEELGRIAECIRRAGESTKTVIGVNENEAYWLGKSWNINTDSIEKMGKALLSELNGMYLFIHTNRSIYGFTESGVSYYEGKYVVKPITVTGAGDHFNAGLCMGLLQNLTPRQAMILGQMAASYYVEYGKTPGRQELLVYLNQYKNRQGES